MPTLCPIQLFVGLGNPGEEYVKTRHNAGAWFVEMLANDWGVDLQFESKFHGKCATATIEGKKIRLLLPTTFMNASGQSVRALSQFYQIPPEAILIAHDELDFSPGVIRLKLEGGHGGHNGLRDIMQHLQTDHFNRLRIGIGSANHRSQTVDYVLNSPNKQDQNLIFDAFQEVKLVLPELLAGDLQAAAKILHTEVKPIG